MGYISGEFGKSGKGIFVPIDLEMRPLSVGLGYGETPLLDGCHFTLICREVILYPLLFCLLLRTFH
jgi:hypothetical protein